MDWATNEVAALHCTYDPETRGGAAPDGRRVKGTIHWVSAAHAVPAELRLYDHLFTVEDPTVEREGLDWRSWINPASLEILTDARVEASLANVAPGTRVQFERVGYFSADPDSRPGAPVFNRIVGLKDSWAKIEKAQGGGA
jgi:glutaminyl-tRNA synthetase